MFPAIRAALRESEVEQSAPTRFRFAGKHSERDHSEGSWREDNGCRVVMRGQRNRVSGQVYRYVLFRGAQQDQSAGQQRGDRHVRFGG